MKYITLNSKKKRGKNNDLMKLHASYRSEMHL